MAGSVQHTSGRNHTNSPRFELYNDDDDDDDDEDENDGDDDDDDVGDGVKKRTHSRCALLQQMVPLCILPFEVITYF